MTQICASNRADPSANRFYFNTLAFRVMTRERASRRVLAQSLHARSAARRGHAFLSAPGAIEMVV